MAKPRNPILNAIPELFGKANSQQIVQEDYLLIANSFSIHIRYTSKYLAERMSRSIAHLSTQGLHPSKNADSPLVLTVCDGPLPAEACVETTNPVTFAAEGNHSICVQTPPQTISVLDQSSGTAVFWICDERDFPWYEQSCPLRNIFHWWFRERNLQLIHGAAIAADNVGVLVLGTSGAGKSTTTLACLRSGLSLVADDISMVDMRTSPFTVTSLYNSIKFNSDAEVSSLPSFGDLLNAPPPEGEKYIGFMSESLPEQHLLSAPLRAILINSIGSNATSSVSRITANEATKLLLAPVTEVLLGPMPADFFAVFRLLKSVPCYVLHAGSDLNSIAPMLVQLLKSAD